MLGFIGDVLGLNAGQQARNDINAGTTAATGKITAGQSQALGNYGQGYNTFTSALAPFAQGGQAGYNAYQSALGLNGAGAQNNVSSAYLNSPIQQQIRNLTLQGINRAYAPTGQGGAATQAATNALLGNWNNYLGQLGGVAQQGVDTGSQLAQGGYRYGSDLANTNFGTAQLLANLRMAQANANAGSRFGQAALNQGLMGNIIRGFTPGQSGSSPFGSMAGGINSLFGGGSGGAGGSGFLGDLGSGIGSVFGDIGSGVGSAFGAIGSGIGDLFGGGAAAGGAADFLPFLAAL